ncbi:hypothetical protein [Methylobacterium soli]|nr:hypothetical protein [Methylobacterium soli]GJE41231.1 hypothetical protein AEGHOMDF_0393 [Methylobacterium soli]
MMQNRQGETGPTPEPRPTRPERDFGDSAGYGSGGSSLDRREVGDDGPSAEGRPNPLDAVIKPRRDAGA